MPLCWGVHGRTVHTARADRAHGSVGGLLRVPCALNLAVAPHSRDFFFLFSLLPRIASRARSPPLFPQLILRPTAFHRPQRSRSQQNGASLKLWFRVFYAGAEVRAKLVVAV